MSAWRLCIYVLSGLLLASCATKDPSSLAYGKRDIGIDDAFILPGDRSVVGITQERASNAIIQNIALSTNSTYSGENYFLVTLFGPVNSAGASENTLSYSSLTEGKITRELRTEMAGVAMTRSPYYVQNNYGPFSYATGRTANGENCIYAWQQIRSPANTQNFFQNRGRIDIRLRLCEAGASQEKLLASMYEFTINATIAVNGWNPFGEPAGPSPELGRPGNPLLAPSVNSNLSGPFPATDLNTSRLNTTVLNTDNAEVSPKSAPAPKRTPVRQVNNVSNDYPQTVPHNIANPYSQAPIVVPAPHQLNPNGASQINTSNSSYMSQYPSIPSSVVAPQGAATAGQVINAPAVTVPSPCGLAGNQSSGTQAGNISAVCP